MASAQHARRHSSDGSGASHDGSGASHNPVPLEIVAPDWDGLERLGDQIVELSARIQAATYHLMVLIREFDDREGWGGGFSSCAHWLNWRTGLNMGAAREKVRVARALHDLPQISEAMCQGRVSYSKVRAMTRVATPDNEERILNFALCGTAAHVERLVRSWRRVDRIQEAERDDTRRSSRSLTIYTDEDGMLVVRGRLDPETGAVFRRALEAAADRLYQSERERHQDASSTLVQETPLEHRHADAIALVAESALAARLDPGTAGDRYQVVVHVDADVLTESATDGTGPSGMAMLEDGIDVSAETSRRMGCDCATVSMTHDSNGQILDVGRKTRTISPAMRRALRHRDRSCRFPGCGVTVCDGHHVRHWADGGETKLDNLVLLCRRHHRAVHEEGFRVEFHADGQVRFYDPHDRLMPQAPPAPDLDDHAWELADYAEPDGVSVGGWTGSATCGDGRIDWGLALQVIRCQYENSPRFREYRGPEDSGRLDVTPRRPEALGPDGSTAFGVAPGAHRADELGADPGPGDSLGPVASSDQNTNPGPEDALGPVADSDQNEDPDRDGVAPGDVSAETSGRPRGMAPPPDRG